MGLFDEKRVDKLRKAVAEDKPLPGIKRQPPMAEPPALREEKRAESGINLPPSQIDGPVDVVRLPFLLFGSPNAKSSSEDQKLMRAVQHGDVEKAREAIAAGANVNIRYPTSIIGGNRPGEEVRIESKSVLRLALESGDNDVAELLRQNGAKE